jgi:hypothetical protein
LEFLGKHWLLVGYKLVSVILPRTTHYTPRATHHTLNLLCAPEECSKTLGFTPKLSFSEADLEDLQSAGIQAESKHLIIANTVIINNCPDKERVFSGKRSKQMN